MTRWPGAHDDSRSLQRPCRVLPIVLTALVAVGALGACGRGYEFFVRNLAALGTAPRPVRKRVCHPRVADARLAVLWVGHSTALVQLDDRFLLTDPVFTCSVGQLSRRLVEPGLLPENLPTLDAVVVSHLHFDHLSLASLEMIAPKVRWLALPPGGLVYLTDFPFRVSELAPWQAQELDGLRITAVAVKHGGWRYALDREWMTQSFTGYVVEYHGLTVYFGGDTAYAPELFRETARRFPHIDLALLPIAPVAPREFMAIRHLDPAQALDAFGLLGARTFVPIHFDTFVNSFDQFGQAPALLRQLMVERHVPASRVALLEVGEQRVLMRAGPRDQRAQFALPDPCAPPPLRQDSALWADGARQREHPARNCSPTDRLLAPAARERYRCLACRLPRADARAH